MSDLGIIIAFFGGCIILGIGLGLTLGIAKWIYSTLGDE